MLLCCERGILEAGVDEAGRGPLVGSVVAAAVILPYGFEDARIRDSKKMSERQREELEPIIKERALAWGIGEASAAEIDEVNILQATFLAMNRAIAQLVVRPDLLLVDGNRFRGGDGIEYRTVVGGDGKHYSIAAASILAKTERDRQMRALDAEFPMYGWGRNKGYPTREHLEALREYGVSEYHRRSYRPVREVLGVGGVSKDEGSAVFRPNLPKL